MIMASITKNNENLPLVNHFLRLGQLYYAKGEKQKGGTFSKVASLISEQEEFVGPDFDLTQFPRVGSSSQSEKNQFLEKGTSERMVELLSDPKAPMETFQEKLTRLLTMKHGQNLAGRIKNSLLLTFATNRIKTVDDALEKCNKFEGYLQEDLEDLLKEIKGGL